MPIAVTCPNPSCTHTSRVAETAVGKTAKCSRCGRAFVVPPSAAATAVKPTTDDAGPRLAKPATASTPLQHVGRFVVRAKVGEGAFGAVYRAYDPHLDREVALKVPHAAVLDSPKRVERFLREAKAAANLRHPHIVPVFDAGTDAGRHYIAAAFIDGTKLADAVEASDGGLDFDRAARLVRELAEALAYAHQEGIVHRDVKPDNVMLDKTDRVHLMDFGLAAKQDEEAKLTRDGAVMGTPSYMSPEQAKGETDKVGPAADQYACGVVLYELLTGQTPFSGPIPVVIHNQIHTEPDPPKKLRRMIPRDLETVCLKALRKDPAARYENCQELADDLRRWQEGEPVSARRLGAVEKTVRWVGKNKLVAGLAISLGVALVAGIVGSLGLATVALREAARAGDEARIARDEREEAGRQRDIAKAATEVAQREKQRADETAVAEREQRNKAESAKAEAESQRADAQAERDAKQKQLVLTEYAVYRANLQTAYGAWKGGRMDVARKALGDCQEAHRGWEYDYLQAACDTVNLRVTDEQVRAICMSRDGLIAFVGRQADVVQLWYPASRKVLREVHVKHQVRRLAFSPDGTRLASLGEVDRDGRKTPDLVVCDVKTGTLTPFPGLAPDTSLDVRDPHIAYSPKGTHLAVCGSKGSVTLWDVAAPSAGKVLECASYQTFSLRFSADGRELFLLGGSPSYFGWSVSDGKPMAKFESGVPYTPFEVVTLAPDGKQFAGFDMRTFGSVLTVGTIQKAKSLAIAGLDGAHGRDTSIAYSPDGTRLAVGFADGYVLVIDPKAERITHTLRRENGSVWHLVFSHDNRFLVCGGGNAAHRWDLGPRGNVTCDYGAYLLYYHTLSPDGSLLAAVARPHDRKKRPRIVVWSTTTGGIIHEIEPFTASLDTIAFSPDGKRLAAIGSDDPNRVNGGTSWKFLVRTWNSESGIQEVTMEGPTGRNVDQFQMTDDGKSIGMSVDRVLYTLDARTGAEKAKVPNGQMPAPQTRPFSNYSWSTEINSPVGSRRAFTDADGSIQVYDSVKGKKLFLKGAHVGGAIPVAFTPDGLRLLTCGSDGTSAIWDVAEGHLLLRVDESWGVAHLSPDRKADRLVNVLARPMVVTRPFSPPPLTEVKK